MAFGRLISSYVGNPLGYRGNEIWFELWIRFGGLKYNIWFAWEGIIVDNGVEG